ncbi:MAG: hypothetical protein Q8T13_09705 [Acidobacteriota bacterium]|nr:hypothetical protein [Acidobacteriota bacterium]
MARLAHVIVAVLLLAAAAQAQWLGYPAKHLPRNADGTANLSAPAPRTADGKIDLSGVWEAAKGDDPPGGIEAVGSPRYLINVMRDFKGGAPFQPWAAEIFRQRQANKLRDNPRIRCLPTGVPGLVAYTHPYKIVQTADLIVIMYESQTLFRQIFMDGRSHPVDPEPTWLGYSIGKWEGDTLVVDTLGFNDKTWLDGIGHPHSEAMRVTERMRRRDVGHMDIEVVIDDPKAYTQQIRYVQPQQLVPDGDLIEYICNENAKPVGQ